MGLKAPGGLRTALEVVRSGKFLVALIFVALIFGTFAAFDLRNRMSASRLGSDIVYAVDGQGNAAVEMTNKSYFVDAATADNFNGMVARMGQPDTESFRKSVEESTTSLANKTGRPLSVSDFQASFQRTPDYGAQVYRFRWAGFADKRDGQWVVDFRVAGTVKLTKDSSLSIVLPPGATLVKAEPVPTGGDGARKLVWTGPGEISWPYIEYK